jgi:hypothetical protein
MAVLPDWDFGVVEAFKTPPIPDREGSCAVAPFRRRNEIQIPEELRTLSQSGIIWM